MQCTLILGATGFLGPHLVAAAFQHAQMGATMADPFGDPVIGVGRDVEGAPRYTNPRDGAEWISHDLEPEGAAVALLDELKPTHVVLAAAMARAGACEANPNGAHRMNVEVPAEVAAWCARSGARLVFISTDQVFGGQPAPKKGFTEEALPEPVQVYGRTKAAGEIAVLEACPGALVVRLPLLYGDSGGRGLGASDSLLMALDRGKDEEDYPEEEFEDEEGEAEEQAEEGGEKPEYRKPMLFEDEFRNPLEVGNAAQAVIECLYSDHKGLLHLASKQRVDRYSLGLAILRAMGLPDEQCSELVQAGSQGDVATGAPRAADVCLDASRASNLLETALLGLRRGLESSMGV
ncbi:MAG: sugar nucleotide-binding protein [Planctomycetota bacterium]|nr:sugar nucleotide-binding protein [Planctomycetota bacterium]